MSWPIVERRTVLGRAAVPWIAVAIGFAAYIVQSTTTALTFGFLSDWLPLALLMANAFNGMTAAIAMALMFPAIDYRSWQSVATASGVLAAFASVAAVWQWAFVGWRGIAAFLLAVASTALFFARARPHLPLPRRRSVGTLLTWLFGFMVLVASIDLRLYGSLRFYAEPIVSPSFQRSLILAEIYFIEACVAAALLVKAPRVSAVIGVILLATPHALRPFLREHWACWQWMRPAAAILLAHSMLRPRQVIVAGRR